MLTTVVLVAAPVPAAAQQAGVHSVTGRLVDGSGRPLGGHAVILSENRGIANDIFGSFAAVFSLGLSCVAGADPCRSSGSSRVDTDGAGHFTFDVAQVTQAMGHSQGVVLAAGDPTAEGSVTVRLNPSIGGDLGDVPLWDPHLVVGASGGALGLRWSAPPTSNGSTVLAGSVVDGVPSPANRSPRIYDTFRQNGVRGAVDLDPRGWEDRPAAISLTVGFHRARAGQNPRIDWLARPVPVRGAGAPPSRGAPCRFTGLPAIQTCPLTDGDLFTVFSPTTGPCPAPPSTTTAAPTATGVACGAPTAIVDLGRAVQAGAVVVRPAAVATVSVSTDGATWRALTPASPSGLLAASLFDARGASWRYVRVVGGSPAEVSVWPPGPATSATFPSPPGVTAPGGVAAPSPRPARHGASGFWLGVALLLLGVVIGALLTTVVRTLRESP